MTAKKGRLVSEGIEQKGRRTHGHRQQCGDCRVGGKGYKGLNGNGKKHNKKFKK